MATVLPVKAAQQQAVDDGDRPVKDSVYFVPSRREDLYYGVGEEDEDEGDDAVGGLAGVPEGDGQHDVCNRRTGSGWVRLNGTVSPTGAGPFRNHGTSLEPRPDTNIGKY